MLDALYNEIDSIPYTDIKQDYSDYADKINQYRFIDSKARSFAEVPKDLLRKFDHKYDKFTKVRYLSPKGHMFDNIAPYILIDKDDRLFLRTKVRFDGGGWIFMDKMFILINGDVDEYVFKGEPDRDVNSRAIVRESFDNLVDEHLYTILNKIVNAKSVVSVRLEGDKRFDMDLNERNIRRIRETLQLFNYLKLY